MKEYFNLQGIECSKKLRRKLSESFNIVEKPEIERYALMEPNDKGDCKLHMENGWCGLQYEKGEKSLPLICRLYPRGIRSKYAYECSCSNSCEKTIELFLDNKDPLGFKEKTMTINIDKEAKPVDSTLSIFYLDTRKICISILQNRKYHFHERMIIMGQAIKEIYDIYHDGLLKDISNIDQKYSSNPIIDFKNYFNSDISNELKMMHKLAYSFGENSQSIQKYFADIQAYFNIGCENDISDDKMPIMTEKYYEAKNHLETIFPDWEILFEHIMVNHLFFEAFPFSDYRENIWAEYVSFCGVYSFVRYLLIGYMANRTSINDMVDLIAAAFRLIEHSCFDKNVDIMLKTNNYNTIDRLAKLLSI